MMQQSQRWLMAIDNLAGFRTTMRIPPLCLWECFQKGLEAVQSTLDMSGTIPWVGVLDWIRRKEGTEYHVLLLFPDHGYSHQLPHTPSTMLPLPSNRESKYLSSLCHSNAISTTRLSQHTPSDVMRIPYLCSVLPTNHNPRLWQTPGKPDFIRTF